MKRTKEHILRQKQQVKTFKGRFRPTAERLREICKKGADLLEDSPAEQRDQMREVWE